MGSYHARIYHTFSEVGIGMPAVVIIDLTIMKPTSEEICDAKKNTEYQNLAQNCEEWSLNLLVDIESVRACNRPRQPCLWFESRYANLSNDKATIKNWMRNNEKPKESIWFWERSYNRYQLCYRLESRLCHLSRSKRCG